MSSLVTVSAAFALAAAACALITPLFAFLARRGGVVSAPRPDRWGGRPTPLLGGIPIVLAVAGTVVLIAPIDERAFAVLGGTIAALGLGLLDDLRHLRPTSKIVGQVAIASGLALAGVHVQFVEFEPLAFLLTLLWIVGMMNAVNLVDNMDGLAAGIAGIAAGVLVLMAGPSWTQILAAAVAGACVGFLVHNFAPARIYMGDAGSLALGFVLAALALLLTRTAASGVGFAVLGPLLVLGLPIFDTTLVAIVRRLEGRPLSLGGRDHASHRLAARGLSDRETVLTLYAVAAALAGIGLLSNVAGLAFVPFGGLAILGLVLFGVFLTESPTADGRVLDPPARSRIISGGRILVRYGAEIALDVALATIALFSAFLVRFESTPINDWLALFLQTAPILIPIQLAAFVLLGVYRTLWSYFGVSDLLLIVRAAFVGSLAASLLMLYALGMVAQSRAVLILDFVFLAVAVMAARLFVVSLRQWAELRPKIGNRRVLIVGASASGETALRLLQSSRDVPYQPTGFLDDDPGKQRRHIAGVPVLGRIADLGRIAHSQHADLIIVAVDDDEMRAQVRSSCEQLGLETREFSRSF